MPGSADEIDHAEFRSAPLWRPRSSTSNSCSRPTKVLRPRLTAASNRQSLPGEFRIEAIDLLRLGFALDYVFASEARVYQSLHEAAASPRS